MSFSERKEGQEPPEISPTSFFDEIEALNERSFEGLPEQIPQIVLGESDSSELFQIARSGWKQDFHAKRLQEIVDTLLSGTERGEDHSTFENDLKRMRRAGLVLRNAWASFDKRHQVPETHKRIVRDIGTLRDVLHLRREDRLASAAICLQASLADERSRQEELFVPADVTSFSAHEQRVVESLSQLLRADELSVLEMHRVRRRGARPLMITFLIETLRHHRPDVHDTYLFLRSIDTLLGQKHDEAIEQRLPPETMQLVDPRIKDLVVQFVERYHERPSP